MLIHLPEVIQTKKMAVSGLTPYGSQRGHSHEKYSPLRASGNPTPQSHPPGSLLILGLGNLIRDQMAEFIMASTQLNQHPLL